MASTHTHTQSCIEHSTFSVQTESQNIILENPTIEHVNYIALMNIIIIITNTSFQRTYSPSAIRTYAICIYVFIYNAHKFQNRCMYAYGIYVLSNDALIIH